MKIYTLDCGWAGSIVVIANNIEEAKKLMELEDNWGRLRQPERCIEEHEIKHGFVFVNLGDS